MEATASNLKGEVGRPPTVAPLMRSRSLPLEYPQRGSKSPLPQIITSEEDQKGAFFNVKALSLLVERGGTALNDRARHRHVVVVSSSSSSWEVLAEEELRRAERAVTQRILWWMPRNGISSTAPVILNRTQKSECIHLGQ